MVAVGVVGVKGALVVEVKGARVVVTKEARVVGAKEARVVVARGALGVVEKGALVVVMAAGVGLCSPADLAVGVVEAAAAVNFTKEHYLECQYKCDIACCRLLMNEASTLTSGDQRAHFAFALAWMVVSIAMHGCIWH